MHVLLMGFTETVLDALDRTCPPGSVTILEEPDVWAGRGLAAKASAHPCFRDVCLGRYQQDDHYLTVVAELDTVHAVAPGAEYAVTAAARVADLLGLPGAGPEAAHVLRDKLLLRQVTQQSGMPTPRFREIRSAQDIAEFARGRPCVVKPAQRQASLGVVLLDAGTDVAAAWRECTQADEGDQIAKRPMSWRYLVEERLYGPEYSTECLVRNGALGFLNVTAKRTLTGNRPVEVGHVVPGVPSGDLPVWRQAVTQLVRAVGFDTGMLHAEWKWTADGPVLIECAGRPPGDRITDLIDLAFDVNLIDCWVRLLAGIPVTVQARPVRGAAIHYLLPPVGQIVRIDGLDAARELPGVQRVRLQRRPGEAVGEVRSSWDRAGSALAVGATPGEAEARARRALSLIDVQVS